MKALLLCVFILPIASVMANDGISLTVEHKAKRFLGDYKLQEDCELGEKGTPVKITFFHNHRQGEASASYLNVEAYGRKVSGVDIPVASGWAFNEGNYYGDFSHYQLNHADWVKFGALERLVVEQRLHLFLKKELIKNYFKIETPEKGLVKIESHYTTVMGRQNVLCELKHQK